MRGKALEGGTEGDVVNVLNLQSKRTVSGVVVGRDRVAIVRRQAGRITRNEFSNVQDTVSDSTASTGAHPPRPLCLSPTPSNRPRPNPSKWSC